MGVYCIKIGIIQNWDHTRLGQRNKEATWKEEGRERMYMGTDEKAMLVFEHG